MMTGPVTPYFQWSPYPYANRPGIPQQPLPRLAQPRPVPYYPGMVSVQAQPVSNPVSLRELQKKYPGTYAHLVKWNPLRDAVRNIKQTAHTLSQVSRHVPVKDHELISLDNNTKLAGSTLIATLATLGMKQRVFGVGEALGFLSWFTAMAVTPKVINSLVHLKTGINMNQMYDSTYGQRQNLYKDPNYLPLHILPDKVLERAADKLKIPPGPDRRQRTEEKIRQVSVQAHTWWMLMAGPATPVISGLLCDQLQDPAMRMLNQIKMSFAERSAQAALKEKDINPEVLAKKTKAYLTQLLGDAPESQLSSWWRSFGQGLIREAGLGNALSAKDIVKGDRATQLEKLMQHFEGLKPDGNFLRDGLKYLDQQYKQEIGPDGELVKSGYLEELRTKAREFLSECKDKLSEQALEEQQRLVEGRILNAQSTVTHYRKLFTTMRETLRRKQALGAEEFSKLFRKTIQPLLSDANINAVQGLLNEGHLKTAEKLVGDSEVFREVTDCLKPDRVEFGKAFEILGAAPEKHLLDDALKSVKLRNMWRKRIGLYLGGGMLAATAIYNFLFLGKNYKQPTSPRDGGTT